MNLINCPFCRSSIEDDGSLAGQVVACPQCAGQFQMPGVAPVPPPLPPIAESLDEPFIRSGAPSWKRSSKKSSGAGLVIGLALGIACFVAAVAIFTAGTNRSPAPDNASNAAGALVGGVMLIALMVLGGIFYFLPTIVAFCRDHPNSASIAVVNLFLGWTLIGYAVALAWAVAHIAKRETQVHIHKHFDGDG